MGLDNSIDVKRNSYTNNLAELKRFEESWDKEHKYDFSICYWRKCYNIRDRIIEALWDKWDPICHEVQAYNQRLDTDDIKKIIEVLKSLNKHNWHNYGGSIWEWSEYNGFLKTHIKNLKYLLELMNKYDLEVYFYDSY